VLEASRSRESGERPIRTVRGCLRNRRSSSSNARMCDLFDRPLRKPNPSSKTSPNPIRRRGGRRTGGLRTRCRAPRWSSARIIRRLSRRLVFAIPDGWSEKVSVRTPVHGTAMPSSSFTAISVEPHVQVAVVLYVAPNPSKRRLRGKREDGSRRCVMVGPPYRGGSPDVAGEGMSPRGAYCARHQTYSSGSIPAFSTS